MSNKSGIAEQVITLAKGGGEMKGLGETFSPDLHTGTGNFGVPIGVPSGRGNFQPELGLAYSTGNGNTCFGLGWQLSIPGISRKTAKGIPRYQDADLKLPQDTFLLSGAEDLVPVEQQDNWTRYQPRTEGLFALITRFKDAGADYWEVKSKDGLVSYYGHSPFLPEKEPAILYDPQKPDRVFSWSLVETRDLFGNRIIYSYDRDRVDDGVRNAHQLYLRRISYLDYPDAGQTEQFLVSVELEYEERPDPFSVYASGFEIRTTQRCRRIVTYTHPEPAQNILVKTYDFDYETAPWSKTSLLKRVGVKGYDGDKMEALPPLEFTYTDFTPKGQRFRPVSGKHFPTTSLADETTELVDLFGNGLPDIVQMNGVVRYWKNVGGGRFESPRIMQQAPVGVSLADPSVQFMDVDGEGKVDLWIQQEGVAGFFPTNSEGQWDQKSFVKQAQVPSFLLQDPEVKLLDLDGDGITDALRTGSRLEAFFNDPQKGWYTSNTRERKQEKDFPNVRFSDPRVRLADMSGDGLQDIVFIHGRSVAFWPNLGYNRWGKRIIMRNAPQLPPDYDPRRLLLGDIAGDGPHDLIYVDHREIHIWINQHGNGFSERITINGTPEISDADAIRLVDLYGSGTSGILWSADQRTTGRDHYFFLDLTDEIKPFVLREMNNNMGAVTKVKYRPSTYYYLQDEQDRSTRWKTRLPFPVQVVACVEVIDEISRNKLVTEYRYRHGYWDGAEREFRGFGRVEQIDTQSFEHYMENGLHGDQPFQAVEERFYAPPTKTITWFHQGPAGPGEGDWSVPDYAAEYWQGDAPKLAPFSDLEDFLRNLPARRQRRDALRTLRGSILRTELYTLDDRSGIPWTVSESVYTVRKEGESLIDLKGMSRAIFFPMAAAQRSTNWERGDDPMTRFGFTGEYDDFGQALTSVSIACPRGWRGLSDLIDEDTPFLATRGKTEMAYSPGEKPYIKDRTALSTTFELLHKGQMNLMQLLSASGDPDHQALIAQSGTYYDGVAFVGLPLKQIDRYGVAVRSENLVINTQILRDIWSDQPGDLPPYFTNNPDWDQAYPEAFLAGVPDLAGYRYHQGDGELAEGFWAGSGAQFDFHQTGLPAKGLVVAQQDALGRVATIDYDPYHFLPVRSVNPIGQSVQAENDYRLFQPYLSIDPNHNVNRVRFSPLGFVTANYQLGKEGIAEGDGLDRNDPDALPGSSFEYDWQAWLERREPISVRSVVREHHLYETGVSADQKENTITSVQFSDGFGRIIQSRTQAEDVLFGDGLLGNELLPPEQGSADDTGPQQGTVRAADEPMNVVVSGWQIYDNKGQVVQQYEPFYSRGFAYADLQQQDQLIGQKVEQFYDPLGRVIKSRNPDGSEQWVVFGIPDSLDRPEDYAPSPWEAYTYDPNDNAGRTGHAASAPSAHWDTPASLLVDALGRTVKATARNREKPDNGEWSDILEYTTASTYDIRGNLLTVTDALGRLVFRYDYDLTFDKENGSRVWRTESADAGIKTSVYNVLGLAIEGRDSKQALNLSAYDTLNRPIMIWVRDNPLMPCTLRQKLVYADRDFESLSGQQIEALRQENRLGTLHRHFDEAGCVTAAHFDFKGNALATARQLIRTEALLPLLGQADFDHFRVDWGTATTDQLLEEKAYLTSTQYDALNRPQMITCPEDVEGKRRVVHPVYNRAGSLEGIRVTDSEAGVRHIAYNARGQRTLVAYGNGLMTRYAYDDRRFRLRRLRTEKYDMAGIADHRFQPGGGMLQDLGYEYDLVGNITCIKDRSKEAGIPNSGLWQDGLDRRFIYDPIYRLLSATGREHSSRDPQGPEPWRQSMTPTNPDTSAVRFYTRQYVYDAVGNMHAMQHVTPNGQGNFTRTYLHEPANNRLTGYAQTGITYGLAYDINGNLVSEGSSRHYFWNHSDQLHGFRVQTAADATPTVDARYLYDAGGERVRKIVWKNGQLHTTTYIGGLFEYHTRGTVGTPEEKANNSLHLMDNAHRFALLRIGDAFDALDDGPAVQYQLADHLGSVHFIVDHNGSFHSREEHYPYGGSSFGSFAKKRYRFTGKERDEESGLNYHSARYYAPWLKKWVSADPAGMVDGVNLYGYGRGNPIVYLDENGLESEDGGKETLLDITNIVGSTASVAEIHYVSKLTHLPDNIYNLPKVVNQVNFSNSFLKEGLESSKNLAGNIGRGVAALGVVTAGWDIYAGIKEDNPYQAVQSGVDLAFTLASFVPNPYFSGTSAFYGAARAADSLSGGAISDAAADMLLAEDPFNQKHFTLKFDENPDWVIGKSVDSVGFKDDWLRLNYRNVPKYMQVNRDIKMERLLQELYGDYPEFHELTKMKSFYVILDDNNRLVYQGLIKKSYESKYGKGTAEFKEKWDAFNFVIDFVELPSL